jgi:hypothetical protein
MDSTPITMGRGARVSDARLWFRDTPRQSKSVFVTSQLVIHPRSLIPTAVGREYGIWSRRIATLVVSLTLVVAFAGCDNTEGSRGDGRVNNFDECVDELIQAGETTIQAMQDCDKAWPNN